LEALERREVCTPPPPSTEQVHQGSRDKETDGKTDGDLDELLGDLEARRVRVGGTGGGLGGESEETSVWETGGELEKDTDDLVYPVRIERIG
jgi:hypothetical protein